MKKAIVIGASRGIGLALAKGLLNQDYLVWGTSRSGQIEGSEELNMESMSLDLAQLSSVQGFLEQVKSEEIQFDLLINNAGIGPDLDTEIPVTETFDQTFDVNVRGIVFLTEGLIERMSEEGRILNISSKMGSVEHLRGYDAVAYRMSKSALNMYSKILANRLKGKIGVVSIHPGWVRTTIAPSSIHGRLSPEESAGRILNYLNTRFKSGDYWDAEDGAYLKW